MKPKFIITAATLILSLFSYSQNVDVTVHFPKGSDVIEDANLFQLKIWAASNYHKRHELVQLRGHTDVDADNDYNLKLSERRNLAVLNVLNQAGFDHADFRAYGESWPRCNESNEACMRENRRVEVVLCDLQEEKFMLGMTAEAPQVSFINHDVANEIIGNEGTKIFFPPHIFTTCDGFPVSENIRIELREFYNLKDCILQNLTTTSNGEFIESGGMINIKAYQGNEELQVAEGQSYKLIFASQTVKAEEGMEVFYGNFDSGKLNWQTDGQIKSMRSINILSRSKSNDTKPKKKSGPQKQDFWIAGRDVAVSYGDDYPTIAVYKSREYDKEPLTDSDRLMLLSWLRNGYYNGALYNSAAVFQVTGMSWINCDRFMDSPAAIVQQVVTNVSPSAIYLLVLEDSNAIMAGAVGSSGELNFPKVPPDRKAVLICYEANPNKNLFGLKHIVTSRESVQLDTSIMSDREVNDAMEVFNKSI